MIKESPITAGLVDTVMDDYYVKQESLGLDRIPKEVLKATITICSKFLPGKKTLRRIEKAKCNANQERKQSYQRSIVD